MSMPLMQRITPTLWPEATQPTAEQFAEWLKICTDAERVHFAEKFQQFADDARRCWEADHEAQICYLQKCLDYERERCEQYVKALNALRSA
jgi:hypothetical protein